MEDPPALQPSSSPQVCANRHFLRNLGSRDDFPISQPTLSCSGAFALCLLSLVLSAKFKPHLPCCFQRTEAEQADKEAADARPERNSREGEEMVNFTKTEMECVGVSMF